MASVKLEDCSQTLELNVIVKKEEEEDERRTEEDNGGVEQEREDGNVDSGESKMPTTAAGCRPRS
jgi:hypothetical protein